MKPIFSYFFITFLLLTSFGYSSHITLQTKTKSCIIEGNNSCELNLEIVNNGDEPAFNLAFEKIYPWIINSRKVRVDRLNPSQRVNVTLPISINTSILPGKYPIIISVRYEDSNGYKFSSLISSYLVYTIPSVSSIRIETDRIYLAPKETKRFTVNIVSEEALDKVYLKLFLPDEFLCESKSKTLENLSRENAEVFSITNSRALIGSSYPYFVVVEYEKSRMHFSAIGKGSIIVAETKHNEKIIFYLLIVTTLIFGFLLIYFKFIRR